MNVKYHQISVTQIHWSWSSCPCASKSRQ